MLSFDGKNQMHSVLNNNLFLVKEHVGLFKAANNFDIYDPESGDVILHCREPRLGMLTKLFRFTDYKRLTPFEIEITTPSGEPVCSVHRGFSFLLSTYCRILSATSNLCRYCKP